MQQHLLLRIYIDNAKMVEDLYGMGRNPKCGKEKEEEDEGQDDLHGEKVCN